MKIHIRHVEALRNLDAIQDEYEFAVAMTRYWEKEGEHYLKHFSTPPKAQLKALALAAEYRERQRRAFLNTMVCFDALFRS